jgi:hypothetical protein
MQNQVKPDSLSSEISSVGGAVPTSPPDENAKCSHGSMAKAGSKGKSPVDPPVEFYCEAYEHGRKIGGFSFMAGDLPEALWKAARHGEVAIRPHITDLRVRTLTEAKEGAAPTSTPLDAERERLHAKVTGIIATAMNETNGAVLMTYVSIKTLNELREYLAASPASALVTGDNKK